jgi:hypothetical protein
MQFTTDLSQSECLERIINQRRIRFAHNKTEKETIETYTEVEDNCFKIYILTRYCYGGQQYIFRKKPLYIGGTVNENEDGGSIIQYRMKPGLTMIATSVLFMVTLFFMLCIFIAPVISVYFVMSLFCLHIILTDVDKDRKNLHFYIKKLLEVRDEQSWQ